MMSLLGAAHQSAVLVISEIEGPADRPERRVESTPSKDMAGDGKVLSDLAPAISELRHSRRPLVDAFMSAFPGSGHQSSIPPFGSVHGAAVITFDIASLSCDQRHHL
jgi:hypothetical protein